VQENRRLEEQLASYGGIKCLWNQGYCTLAEFWKHYDEKRYEAVREKTHAKGRFQGIWEKTCAFVVKWSSPVTLGTEHYERVQRVQAVIEEHVGSKLMLERKKMNFTMHHNEYKYGTVRIDVSDFNHILDINPMTKRVWVEPGVTMEALYKACIKNNLIPCVLPGLKHLTVGGLISGAGHETSSFRYGQFNDTCHTINLLLANGEHRQSTRETNTELFHGVAGAFGSLGILTAVEIECRAAAPKVTLAYHRFSSVASAMESMRTFTKDPSVDFVEGIVLDRNTTALIIGTLDAHHFDMNQLDLELWHAPWFTVHVGDVLRKHAGYCGQIPLEQYLFRHDRGAFWTGMYARTSEFGGFLPKISVGRMKNVRKIFDAATLRAKLHEKDNTEREKSFVFQDIYVPFENTANFVEECDTLLGIYPIWLCPVKATTKPQFFNRHLSHRTDLVIDVGLYGVPTTVSVPYDGIKLNRRLEELMQRTNSLKMFYGHA